ncbi:conserved hypothetical protein [Cupriavidus taiwanensis]|nr:conserved hypothetical protein [Cupriavidus taiwanensis]
MLTHVAHHLRLHVVQLGLDGRHDGLDARVQPGRRDLQPLAFGVQHGQQLAPARNQGRHPLPLGVGQRAQEARKVFALHQYRGQFGEHARIDGLGLCEAPHGFGEIAGLARVDHRHKLACRLQRTDQCRLVAAGGLHHHQANPQRLQGRGQCRMALGIVGKLLGIAIGAQYTDIDVCLRNVNTNN